MLPPVTPIAEDIKIKYLTVEFNGFFAGQNVYRGPPGPEVDEARKALDIDGSYPSVASSALPVSTSCLVSVRQD